MSRQSRFDWILFSGASLAALAGVSPAVAQDTGRVTDEIVVTAEKRSASVQEVPIAISAFSEDRLERLQLNDAQDLQNAIPNFQFAKGNFTGSNVAIRGVGTKVVATSADQAVGIHLNGAPLGQTPIFETEFYDIERVEVLRGPQGTLYGRNSSSGVLNVITARPELEVLSGRLEGTYGNFNTYRGNAMLNIPIGDTFALRAAGFYLQRDGFTEDRNSGNDIDGRDMWSARLSAYAELSDRADAHLMLQWFEEDSNRSRIGKQLCSRDDRPWPFSQGCLAAPLEFETVNLSSTLGGLGALIFPGTTLGIPGLSPTLLTDPALAGPGAAGTNIADLREVFLTFQPTHQNDDFVATFEFNYDFGNNLTFTSLTSYATNQVSSSVDYNQYVGGQVFNPTIFTPTGTFTGPLTGTQNTLATYDLSSSQTEQITQELRIQSDYDGWFNFTLGGIYIDGEATDGTYQVISNSLEAIGIALGVPQDQYFFESLTGSYTLKASALFGETYITPTDDLKVTIGLRYTSDEKSVSDRQTLLQAVPRDQVPFNTRTADFDELTGRFTVDYRTRLPFTDESNWYASFARGYKGGGVNPPIDPALFQGVAETFEPEFVNAYEIGLKNLIDDGRMTANFAGFYYDYEGYQITRIVNRTSVNANIDATVTGFEAELSWEPVNRLVFDLNVGWLDSEIQDAQLIDPINVTNGNTGFTNVSDALRWTRTMVYDSGGNFLGTSGSGGTLTTVPAGATVRQVNIADLAGANGGAAQAAAGGIVGNPALATIATAAQCIASTTAVQTVLGINPALAPFTCQLARGFGGDVRNGSDGIAADLDGNSLPNTPEYTVSFGMQYTFNLGGGWTATPRGDVYYQADSFARIFNGPNDELDSYTIGNAQVRFEHEDNGWYGSIFVKNVSDEDVITDLYLTDQSSGLFSNAFLLEPRTYGVTLGKRF
ncbi:MAG: TonB-dependent receptor plug domain-containing protein [Alphaproteobacteria bacterium]|nr:TonB-dependent receptor plug domain-containing protein [Alphaproteobacteria bacterium]